MQPEELYELDAEETSDLDGAALLVHLEGFMDAGAAGRLLTEHLLDAFEHKAVAKFDTDRLLDYRSRRPLLTFDGGTWESYDAPELTVFRLDDASGKPFLLLTGPEPDHEWEAFAAAACVSSATRCSNSAFSRRISPSACLRLVISRMLH